MGILIAIATAHSMFDDDEDFMLGLYDGDDDDDDTQPLMDEFGNLLDPDDVIEEDEDVDDEEDEEMPLIVNADELSEEDTDN